MNSRDTSSIKIICSKTNVGYNTIYEPTGLIWQADDPIDIHSCLGNSIHEVKYGWLSSGIHQ